MIHIEDVKIPLEEVIIPLDMSLDDYAVSIKRKINYLRIFDYITDIPDVDAEKVKADAMNYFKTLFTNRIGCGLAALTSDKNGTPCYIINPNLYRSMLDEKVLSVISNMDNIRIFVSKEHIFLDEKILSGEVKLWSQN